VPISSRRLPLAALRLLVEACFNWSATSSSRISLPTPDPARDRANRTMAKMRRTALLLLLGTLFLVGTLGFAAAATGDVDLSEDLTEEEREIMSAGDEDEEEGSREPVDEKDVVVLGGKDFADFVAANPYVLAEFYAPWCGHCQSLAPEYARAATALTESGVVLAKVDATQHAELAQEHGVEGYPTLFFFADGEKRQYSGGRTRFECCERCLHCFVLVDGWSRSFS
jgi:protein disulfide-isomerase-like protein